MLLQIIVVNVVYIHVFDVSHKVWFLLRLIIFGLYIVISLNQYCPTCPNIHLITQFFILFLYHLFLLAPLVFNSPLVNTLVIHCILHIYIRLHPICSNINLFTLSTLIIIIL
jgi:hypothetical protein